ncbi:MAG: type II toxin-antitoxin system mRNA interferase toxin, RelE/StbE family [Nitrospirae bacterium]|nr:type II toxin-antitoxin system mRNA interferase toxin, RelE/StbE family [Nitrospirota bacterium]
MSYKDTYHPRVKSDLKSLDRPVVKDIYDIHIERLLNNPELGEKLHGELEGVFSYHFRKNKIDYRIAYTAEETSNIVYIVMIGKRENFYEILKRRLL